MKNKLLMKLDVKESFLKVRLQEDMLVGFAEVVTYKVTIADKNHLKLEW